MIYRPVFRLVLSALERPEDAARAYAVVIDPTSGQSGVYLDGLPWDSPYIKGAPPRFLSGSLGLVSLNTAETFQGHSASLSLLVGEVGEQLRKRILPHDPLRVELQVAPGRWACAFDGHVNGIQWTRSSTPDSYRWRMEITAAGLQKIFSEQWLDWQGFIRAGSSKNIGGTGFSFFHDLAKQQGTVPVSELMRMFITGAVDKFLEFGVRGFRAGSGNTFQFSPIPRDWQTAWDLFVFATGNWYLMQQGPIWSILLGLAEPDVHEFFLSYAQDPNASEYQEIPTLVFRPRPWPGPPASAVTSRSIGPLADDDSIWRQLDVVRTGNPGGRPAAIRVGSSRNDAARSNTFFISLSGATDSGPDAMSAAKTAIGFRADEGLIRRYGFSSRQVSIGSYLKRAPAYFDTILPGVLDRVAWQEAPLPFLLDQTRGYPLLPGVHIGCVLEDYSENQNAPTTGYVISVSHAISGSPKGLHAETSIGTTRALEGVSAEQYPAAVRALVNLQKVSYLDGPGVAEARAQFLDASHHQPAAVNPAPGPDNLLVTDHPELQDTPTVDVAANLSMLASHIAKVRSLVGAITLTSVYRSVVLNRKVGGRDGSAHTRGLAFDFQMPGGPAALLAAFQAIQANAASLGFQIVVFETRHSDGVQWIHYEIPAAGGTPALHSTSASTGD